MAFTYDSELSADRDKVRLFINDTVSGAGPRPSSGNFSDEELDALITEAGTWQGAAAMALRILSGAWTNEANSLKIGPYSVTYTDRAKAFEQRAIDLETKMANTWSGIFSSKTDAGHMFGKYQWGANPDDWTDT